MSDSSEMVPQTYSLLAMGSAAASLGSLGVCVVASVLAYTVSPEAAVVVLVLPVLAFGGAIMGGLALRMIRRSGGAIGGRPLATIGLFVGLASGVLQTAFLVSAMATIWPIKTALAPATDVFLSNLGSGQFDVARPQLDMAARTGLDDTALKLFIQTLEQECGPYQYANFGIDIFVDSRRRLQEAAERGAVPGAAIPTNTPKPVGLKFANTRAIAYVFVDQDAIKRGTVLVSDMLVLLPDGRGVTLMSGGDAAQTALALGIPLVILAVPSP